MLLPKEISHMTDCILDLSTNILSDAEEWPFLNLVGKSTVCIILQAPNNNDNFYDYNLMNSQH